MPSEHGHAWDAAGDTDTPGKAVNLAYELVQLDRKGGDQNAQFWSAKSAEIIKLVLGTFQLLGGRWRLADLVVALTFRPFLRPLLRLNSAARALVDEELHGELGRNLMASVTAWTDGLSVAASYDQRAGRQVSMAEFLALDRVVLYCRFRQDQIKPTAAYVNAAMNTLVTRALTRQVAKGTDYTWFLADEGKYLTDAKWFEDIVAKGRGSGLGGCLTAISVPSLVAAWGADKTKSFVSLCHTWVTFAADHETAKAFCELVGQTEALVDTTAVNTGTSVTDSRSWGGGPGGGTWSNGWSLSHSSGSSTTTAYATRPGCLESEVTGLPTPDNAVRGGWAFGIAYSADTGPFNVTFGIDAEYARLPVVRPVPQTDRPDVPLRPWAKDDLVRLNVVIDEEFSQALAATAP